jgi:hypothetical protein
MALDITVGHTDDGLVFMRFVGQQAQADKPIQTIITMDPDMAEQVANQMKHAANRTLFACKKQVPIIDNGPPLVIPRR